MVIALHLMTQVLTTGVNNVYPTPARILGLNDKVHRICSNKGKKQGEIRKEGRKEGRKNERMNERTNEWMNEWETTVSIKVTDVEPEDANEGVSSIVLCTIKAQSLFHIISKNNCWLHDDYYNYCKLTCQLRLQYRNFFDLTDSIILLVHLI